MMKAKPKATSKYNAEYDIAYVRRREIAYLRENCDELQKQYAGQWIVVEGTTVVSADISEYAAGVRARELGVGIHYLDRIAAADEPLFIG